MDVELAATHEAGHAVMQWLVGWELGELQMTVDGTNASKVSTRCPCPSLDTLAALRRRLLVLFAGNAVTRQLWPHSNNDWGDWLKAGEALGQHFRRNIKWTVGNGRTLDDAEANGVMQDAIGRCGEIVAHTLFQTATAQVTVAFLGAPKGEGGLVLLHGREATAICETAIGEEFRAGNPWSAWIRG